MPSIALCSLVLNEMEWLPKLYEQHKAWPNLTKWIFVESADRVYASTSPHMVTVEGLSVDGTSQFLQDLAFCDPRVVYVPYGFSHHTDPAQGKCDSRTQYLRCLEDVKPDYFFVLDGDEFYTHSAQKQILNHMAICRGHTAFCFKHRHPWHPPSVMQDPLFRYEVEGGFWDIPLCRGWLWSSGLLYNKNHNTPQDTGGKLLDRRIKRFDQQSGTPYCVHMAFTASVATRHAKHQYYANRGEATDSKRSWYVESRACYETWKPGDRLPRNAKVSFYNGDIPECFDDIR
jgi:hypothetical protein